MFLINKIKMNQNKNEFNLALVWENTFSNNPNPFVYKEIKTADPHTKFAHIVDS